MSETDELFETTKSTISSLFRIAVLIRKASPRDRFARALATVTSPFDAAFDIRHVRDKFPLIVQEGKDWLGDRLGNAIAQRRQYLSYARSHRDKLGEEPPELALPHVSSTLKTAKSVAQTTASTLHSADIPPQLDLEDDQSIASSTLSLLGDKDESYLRPPSLSAVSNGETAFECPFCCSLQSFQKETFWQKHVYADLRPYVCTFAGCRTGLFTDQRKWFEHESRHRMQWHCLLCHKHDIKSEGAFRAHILTHDDNITVDQLDTLSKAAQRPSNSYQASDCPFCRTWDEKLRQDSTRYEQPTVTPNQFMKHVGSHMRQLALFALPREYTEEAEDTSSPSDKVGVKNAESVSMSTSNAGSSHRGDESPIIQVETGTVDQTHQMKAQDIPINETKLADSKRVWDSNLTLHATEQNIMLERQRQGMEQQLVDQEQFHAERTGSQDSYVEPSTTDQKQSAQSS
jgi:hypothetical protein